MIIIPDVHGRSFWKECVKNKETEDIIFLGDYLDPYGHEGITPEQAIVNFSEILDFKKQHPNNVTLLLGNHDFGGYVNSNMPRCRYDYLNSDKIIKMFKEDMSIFKLIDYRYINNKFITFSHSFIGNKWLQHIAEFNDKSTLEIIDILNAAVVKDDQLFLGRCLDIVGRARGGYGLYGSVVWADVCEAEYTSNYPQDIDYQIFGHTQLKSLPIIEKKFACLDVRDGFILSNTGVLINDNLNVNQQII